MAKDFHVSNPMLPCQQKRPEDTQEDGIGEDIPKQSKNYINKSVFQVIDLIINNNRARSNQPEYCYNQN